ncbi:hypothetical protein OOU_Y34scaffold01005g67 [Pyricularia oryzae Y34]|uniref:Uncharacterized protein n=1 Tax=Pyricularia oryzae (strain Y34) TaxID=1143189 RepID=A0AA97NMV7_PYRO3|nr:hypothetical protein OOU_Y34scaffold01005g67 [Pyricularia oryzae Y34]
MSSTTPEANIASVMAVAKKCEIELRPPVSRARPRTGDREV